LSVSEYAAIYMATAARTYGQAVLSAGPVLDVDTADAAVALGQRLMRQVFGAGGSPPGALANLITRVEDVTFPAELEDVVQEALARDADLEAAVGHALADFYRQQIVAGNTRAMVDLGDLLRSQDDIEGARAAFEQAINSRRAEWAPAAMVALARVLEKQGDRDGARAAFQQAVDTGNADWAPYARGELQNL
jgi:tetratricopeptide (TPR) repeat protein